MEKWKFIYENGIVKVWVRVLSIIGIFVIALAGAAFLYYHSPEENMWLMCIIYMRGGKSVLFDSSRKALSGVSL